MSFVSKENDEMIFEQQQQGRNAQCVRYVRSLVSALCLSTFVEGILSTISECIYLQCFNYSSIYNV